MAGKSGFRVEAVVERKDASLAGKQKIERKEEQLKCAAGRYSEKGDKGEWLQKRVVDGEGRFTVSPVAAADCRCRLPLAGAGLLASDTGNAKRKQVPAKLMKSSSGVDQSQTESNHDCGAI